LGVALLAGTVIAGAVGLSSMSASGESIEATDPVRQPLGTLTIELEDRSGTVTLDLIDGTSFSQPLVTQQPCAQVGYGPVVPESASTGNLVTLRAIVDGASTPDDTVQLPNDELGVNTGTNCGNPAGLIGPDELLEIEVGPFFEQFRSDPETPAVFADSASLVINKAFNNSGSLTVGYNGGPQGDPIAVATGGATIDVQPADLFTSVTLGSTSSKDSRGLSVATHTSFNLVSPSVDFEVAVDCGQQVTEIGDPGEIATSAVFFRGENDPDKQVDPCDQVGVIVEIDSDDPNTPESEDRVYWDNAVEGVNTGAPQAVNGTVTIVWAPTPVSEVGNATQIDYDADGPADYIDAQWCESFSAAVDVDGKVTFDVELPFYDGPGANADDTAPWCVVSSTDVLNADGTVTRTQQFFGSGDPWARFA
jgi:hypothetical protein